MRLEMRLHEKILYDTRGSAMQIYFAPMEGITGYIFRNAYEACFPKSIDKYFAPFITASCRKELSNKEIKELSSEQNQGIHLVPQLLANNVEAFESTTNRISQYGYDEININLGCPSKTVVTKKKGAGLLGEPGVLTSFLDGVFSYGEKKGIRISIKTRIGMYETSEWDKLLALYREYPIHELIIHPRLQMQYYEGTPYRECFEAALSKCSFPVIYNGDIFDKELLGKFEKDVPGADAVMIGRGFLMHPGFGGIDDLWQFHDAVYDGYCTHMKGETNVLFKMKELFSYLQVGLRSAICDVQNNPMNDRELEKRIRQIRKSKSKQDYESIIRTLKHDCG